jgi:PmbA protein
MEDGMDAETAVDYVLSLAQEHRVPDADVMLARDEKLTLRIDKGRVEKVDQATALGLGVRLVQEGRTGLAFTERLERETLERTFLAAKENAALLDSTPVVLPDPPPPVPDTGMLGLYNPALDALPVDELAAFGLQAEAAARAADARVTAVPHLLVSRDSSGYEVASTRGVRYRQRSNSVGAYCQVLLQHNGQRKSGSATWSRRQWDPAHARKLGEEAVSRAAGLFGARPIASGKLPVVLDEYCAPALLGMYLGAFSAEAAQKGQSRLKGRLGEAIAVPGLTLLDDPHRVGAPGSRYVDAEGTPTRPLALIEDGRLINFAYHVESGRKEGKASTGHAGRGYNSGIGTRLHNVVWPAGPHSLDALAAIPSRCLLVTELEGGAGCNPLSGDISIGVQGYLVENGRRLQPVDSVTVAGNFFDLLKNVEAQGNAYQPNLSRLFIPALLVNGMVIAG